VQLADFGASTRTDFDKTQETESIKGTPYFMAPEVLAESKYGRKGDIWAVGCTIIQMFTGQPPWKDRNLSTMVQLHLLLQNWNGPPTYPHETVSADCRAAIELCFQRDSAQRPSADTLLECAFLVAEDDLDKSWGSQQLGASGERFSHARSDSGSDDHDFKIGGDGDGDGDGDALGVSNTMRELKAKMTRVAGAGPGGGIWRSMEAPDAQDEPTEHVRRQLADRQRAKDLEQRRQRHNDDDDGHDTGGPMTDEPLPPARYGTSPQLQKPSGQESNPYARGASRSKAREVKGEPVATAAAASIQHRPSSRELGRAAEAKSETPRTTPISSAATTPTRGNHSTPSTSPQRGEAPLNLRVATHRDQHHIVKTSAPGSRPSSKESSASLRGPGGSSTQQVSKGSRVPHRYGGLSSARDTEELTPSPYPNDGQAEGVGEDEDEDELLVLEDQGWVCQFCFKINSAAEQTSYCDFCAKTRRPTPLVKSYAQSEEHK
jgi:serine/threonine protein kinase